MKLSQHLYEITEPNVADFLKDRANLRLGLNAAWSLDSLASHIFEARKEAGCTKDTEESKFKKRLADAHLEFRLVWDVSSAAKHGRISNKTKIIRTSAQIQAVPIEGPLAMVAGVSATDWGDRILIAHEDFFARPLDVAVRNSLEMLRTESSGFM